MKLIVDIPDYRYRAIKKIDTTKKPYTINERSAITAIKNGKALEQEPVIDKIRSEIEAYANQATDEKQRIAFNSCLNLIDGYTKLKEEKRG